MTRDERKGPCNGKSSRNDPGVELVPGLNQPISAAGGSFKRVLIGSDGSVQSQQALRAALALVGALQGEGTALRVLRPPAHAETDAEQATMAQAEKANLALELEEATASLGGHCALATDVVSGDDPARAIARYAEQHGFDLIVVGGHGRERMTHGGLGHAVAALLADHPCPVLVV
jgi:nucleotide-binding universal stress UspA family protein